MNYKRLIPCIFIYQGKAVKWFDNLEILSDDVVKLAKKYNDMGADELLVFDLSTTDEEHDHAIDLMKKMNRVIRIPMVAGGNIRRQEDVKKILYTGAKRAILNFSKALSVELIEDVSKRFGKEKIAVSLNDFDALFKQQHLIEVFQLDLIYAQAGFGFCDEHYRYSKCCIDRCDGGGRDSPNFEVSGNQRRIWEIYQPAGPGFCRI